MIIALRMAWIRIIRASLTLLVEKRLASLASAVVVDRVFAPGAALDLCHSPSSKSCQSMVGEC